MTVGIYGIFDKRNDECLYVGQSRNIEGRIKGHMSCLKNENHIRKEFVDWFIGNDKNFSILKFDILEECLDETNAKNELEIKWFNIYKPKFYAKKPSTKESWTVSNETRNKISARYKTQKKYDEQIIDM